jgi:hypothetical protein
MSINSNDKRILQLEKQGHACRDVGGPGKAADLGPDAEELAAAGNGPEGEKRRRRGIQESWRGGSRRREARRGRHWGAPTQCSEERRADREDGEQAQSTLIRERVEDTADGFFYKYTPLRDRFCNGVRCACLQQVYESIQNERVKTNWRKRKLIINNTKTKIWHRLVTACRD